MSVFSDSEMVNEWLDNAIRLFIAGMILLIVC